jgi:hypothetical protein
MSGIELRKHGGLRSLSLTEDTSTAPTAANARALIMVK